MNAQDIIGNEPLNWLYKNDVVKLLMEKGADFNVLNKNGYAVLHSAVYLSQFEMVQTLIESGADLEVQWT